MDAVAATCNKEMRVDKAQYNGRQDERGSNPA